MPSKKQLSQLSSVTLDPLNSSKKLKINEIRHFKKESACDAKPR